MRWLVSAVVGLGMLLPGAPRAERPVQAMLLLDMRSSAKPFAVRERAAAFVRAFGKDGAGDLLGVWEIAEKNTSISFFMKMEGKDRDRAAALVARAALRHRVDEMLGDALGHANTYLGEFMELGTDAARVIIVVHAGSNASGAQTLDENLAEIQQRGFSVFVVALGDKADTAVLTRIATAGGTKPVTVSDSDGLGKAFEDILAQVNTLREPQPPKPEPGKPEPGKPEPGGAGPDGGEPGADDPAEGDPAEKEPGKKASPNWPPAGTTLRGDLEKQEPEASATGEAGAKKGKNWPPKGTTPLSDGKGDTPAGKGEPKKGEPKKGEPKKSEPKPDRHGPDKRERDRAEDGPEPDEPKAGEGPGEGELAEGEDEKPAAPKAEGIPAWVYYAAGGAGGFVLLLMIVLIVVWAVRRRSRAEAEPARGAVAAPDADFSASQYFRDDRAGAGPVSGGQQRRPLATARFTSLLEGFDGFEFSSDSEVVTVGRRPNNDLVLNHRGCSGYHAELRWVRDRLVVVDKGSTNGTFVNDQRVTERALQCGDIVRFDAIGFEVGGQTAVAAAAEPPGHAQGGGDKTMVMSGGDPMFADQEQPDKTTMLQRATDQPPSDDVRHNFCIKHKNRIAHRMCDGCTLPYCAECLVDVAGEQLCHRCRAVGHGRDLV